VEGHHNDSGQKLTEARRARLDGYLNDVAMMTQLR
jgi:hypothetical protein